MTAVDRVARKTVKGNAIRELEAKLSANTFPAGFGPQTSRTTKQGKIVLGDYGGIGSFESDVYAGDEIDPLLLNADWDVLYYNPDLCMMLPPAVYYTASNNPDPSVFMEAPYWMDFSHLGPQYLLTSDDLSDAGEGHTNVNITDHGFPVIEGNMISRLNAGTFVEGSKAGSTVLNCKVIDENTIQIQSRALATVQNDILTKPRFVANTPIFRGGGDATFTGTELRIIWWADVPVDDLDSWEYKDLLGSLW